MYLYITILIFVFGLIIGSFINAQQYRIEIGRKNNGRSFCPKCNHQLSWYDLFPLLSWAMLRGKCRYCKKPISWHYPLVELLTGVAFVGIGLKSGYINELINYPVCTLPSCNRGFALLLISLVCLLFLAGLFILIALHDARTGYVLSTIVYLSAGLVIIYLLSNYFGDINLNSLWMYSRQYILSAIVAGGMFYIIYIISKGRWMGAGDIEIAALMGLFLGWPNILVSLYFAFITGAIYGSINVICHKSKLKSAIPFGPFLITGIFFAYFFGPQIFSTYTRVFLGL